MQAPCESEGYGDAKHSLTVIHRMNIVRRQIRKSLLCPFLEPIVISPSYNEHISISAADIPTSTPDIPQFSPRRKDAWPRLYQFDVGKFVPLWQAYFAYTLRE